MLRCVGHDEHLNGQPRTELKIVLKKGVLTMRTTDIQRCLSLPLTCLLLIASSGLAQERPPVGKVNTEFSRVYIFVDKAGVVGHKHAVEGKLVSGDLFQNNSREGALVFDMQSFDAHATS
jgi:hypothetical protein